MMARPFVNPYNFLPLSVGTKERGNERPAAKEEEGSVYTGKIRYSVTTATPLFIPNTSRDNLFGVAANHQDQKEYHKSFDFFSYHDLSRCEAGTDQPYYAPVIPGSEMRGAVRGIYEALTDSCLSITDEDDIFSRRTPERFCAGLLMRNADGTYILKEAEDCICRDSDDFSVFFPGSAALKDIRDGSAVHYRSSRLNMRRAAYARRIVDIVPDPQAPEGCLIKGQAGPVLPKPSRGEKCRDCPPKTKEKCDRNKGKECYLLMKHNAHVFAEKSGERGIRPESWPVTGLEIRFLDTVLEIYKKNNADAHEEYRDTWKDFKAGRQDVFPVYYSVLSAADGKKGIQLSPACVTREVYQHTLESVLGRHYLACEDQDHLCPACRLFGTVNKGLARASAIRFSDLTAEEKDNNEEYYGELLTLDELGQPKPSSMEFYLKKPEVTLRPGEKLIAWTFDYYITVDGDGRPGICFYDPDIAGRKFYWHSRKAAGRQKTLKEALKKEEEWSQANPDQDKYITKRNKTIRPVRSGITFYGDLYFNRITKTQLDQLIAVLNMSKSGKYGIKLGGAKPLGLGSVELKVCQVDYRSVLFDEGKMTYQSGHYDFQNAAIEDYCDARLLKAFDFDAVDEDTYEVAYPYVDGVEEDGFTWFVANREAFAYKKKPRGDGRLVTDFSRLDVDGRAAGPGSRLQVPYRKYMVALRPELADSGFGKGSRNGGNEHNTNSRPGYQGNQGFIIGKEYEGKVVGYNGTGKFAKAKLDAGGMANFYDADHKYENRRVKLRYAGKDDRGYDKWRPVD